MERGLLSIPYFKFENRNKPEEGAQVFIIFATK